MSLGRLEKLPQAQLGALAAEARDLALGPGAPALRGLGAGNGNRLWHDERGAANPLLENALGEFLRNLTGGADKSATAAALQGLIGELERRWGAPAVSDPAVLAHPQGAHFAARKACRLWRMELHPSRVSEGFLTAAGTVAGREARPRTIFWQRYRPAPGAESGKIAVLSPGFQETGRHFEAQIQELLRMGHDVLVMDHQWAGMSGGKKGDIDDGFVIARDFAAVAAHAQEIVEREYSAKPGAEIIAYGNSMGAFAATLAATLNDRGDLTLAVPELGARQMPRGIKLHLQDPYFGSPDTLGQHTLEALASLPILNQIRAPSVNFPRITSDPVAQKINRQEAVAEGVGVRPHALVAVQEAMQLLFARLEAGQGPLGKVSIYHQKDDPLAAFAGSERVARLLSRAGGEDRVDFLAAEGRDHVVENDPDTYRDPLRLFERLARR